MNANGGACKAIKLQCNSTCVNFELTHHKY